MTTPPKDQISAERVAFEEWAAGHHMSVRRPPEKPHAMYGSDIVHFAWMAWQAAQSHLIATQAERLAALEGEREWRPIETAPKDGTEILLSHSAAGVCAGFCPAEGFAWHVMDGCNTAIGSKSGVSIPRMTQLIGQPNHWQPLPAAPSAAQKGDGE